MPTGYRDDSICMRMQIWLDGPPFLADLDPAERRRLAILMENQMPVSHRIVRSLIGASVMVAAMTTHNAIAAESWDMALPWGPNEFHTRNAVRFAEAASEATGGELTITVHPGGALGIKGPETVRSVRDGVVPLAEAVMLQTVGEIPINSIESLPYLIESVDDLEALHGLARADFESGFGQHNIKVLYMVPWPANQIFSRRELNSPTDFAGLKIRTSDSNATKFFEALGATPVQMPIADVLPALASGAIDATMTSMTTAADQKYWEFLDYGYLTSHLWASNAMLVNKDAWGRLSPEHQVAVEAAANELEPEFWDVSRGEDAKAIEVLRAGGMDVKEPSAELIAAMRAAASPVWEAAFSSIGPRAKEIVDGYLEAVGRN